jgi:hypothetical protein
MTHAFMFIIAFVGFALLLLSQRRHQHEWLPHLLSAYASVSLRFTGLLLLALAFALAGARLGWAYGAVCWFGWLTVAALAVVLVETNRRRLVRPWMSGRQQL